MSGSLAAVSGALADELEEGSGDAVIIVDADDVIVRWSARAERLLGIPAAETLGRAVGDVLGPHLPAATGTIRAQLVRGARWGAAPDRAATRARVAWTARGLLGEGGRYLGALYRGRAVREVPAPVIDAARDLALLSRCFDAAPEAIVVVDRARRVVLANEAAAAMTRLAFGQAIAPGDDPLAFAAPGTEVGFLANLARAFAGERVRVHRPIVYPNGVEFDHYVGFTPVVGAAGVTHVVLGTLALDDSVGVRRTLAHLEAGLAVASFSIMITDARAPDMPLVYVSPGIERMTGWAPAELLGKNPRVLRGTIGPQPALDVLRRALAAGEPCDVVLRNRHKDGRELKVRLVTAPVHDEYGVVSHYIGIQEDVSEREALLDRLRAAASQDTLQKMLGGAVHDLRNMLTVIGAQVALAAEELPPGSDSAAGLASALEAVDRAAGLAHVLLSPVKHVRAMTGSTDVHELAHHVAEVARYTLPSGVALHVDVPSAARGARVIGDLGALEHVLLNLITNAHEALAGPGRIELRVLRGLALEVDDHAERARRASHWTIAVTDDGPGIPPALVPRVFEPYFTTKGPERGTGLGLATSATLVRGVGGRIDVATQPGTGATFAVCLPPAAQTGDVAERSAAVDRARLAALEVLVVEPDLRVRAAVVATLRRRGVATRDAGDVGVARALAASAGAEAALVIDPSAESAAALALLEAWLATPARCAVVLGDHELGGLAGVRVAVLPKPFAIDALLRALRGLSAGAGADPPPR